MDRQELVDCVAEDLFAYVMHGSVSEHHVVSQIRPNGLDERFADFESLVDLHFILRPDVVEFVEGLPDELRSIKTQTRNVQTQTRGSISGRIDWESTIKTRYSQAPRDTGLFICDSRHENYDIDENIVLKNLLSVIYTTLDDCEKYLEQEYDWVTDAWEENLELVDQMRDLFERNVHVKRIRDPESYEPTERMFQTAESARNAIYRRAAGLLREHRQSRSADPRAIRELLRETTVTPDDEETLFELYVLFRYIRAIETHQNGETTVATIETDRQEVARIESETGTDVVLYHDNAARDRGLSFVPAPVEKDSDELTRTELIHRETHDIVNRYFRRDEFQVHSNRPDVIVLEIRADDGYQYLITEVKHSSQPETIRQGVKETLEYLAFLRRDESLVYADETPFGSGWDGVLVVQDIDQFETVGPEEQSTIRIVQASELDEFLPTVLSECL
jgi:hypothetical protein